MTGFQTSVQLNPAYGVPGDFYATGPYTTVEAGPGELTAGASGVVIARFAWAEDSTGVVSNGKPSLTSSRFGFVGRAGQRAVITTFLAESSMTINPGFEVTLFNSGSFSIAAPSGGATIGQRVYAAYLDGSITLGAAASAPTTTLSVTTASGSAAISYTGGSLAPGMPISGTGIPANAKVATVNATAGTATISANATASDTVTATITTGYETSFYVRTPGVAGDLIAISDKGF